MAAYAARYARALADVVASARLDAGVIDRQLTEFAATWRGSAELREVLGNPALPAEQRVAILDKINTRAGLEPVARNFLAVLINHGHIGALEEVLGEYRREQNLRAGIVEARVTTARRLDEDERRELIAQVAKVAGGPVDASFSEDGALLGGVVVRIGSTVYDGSIRGRLGRLKEELAAG